MSPRRSKSSLVAASANEVIPYPIITRPIRIDIAAMSTIATVARKFGAITDTIPSIRKKKAIIRNGIQGTRYLAAKMQIIIRVIPMEKVRTLNIKEIALITAPVQSRVIIPVIKNNNPRIINIHQRVGILHTSSIRVSPEILVLPL